MEANQCGVFMARCSIDSTIMAHQRSCADISAASGRSSGGVNVWPRRRRPAAWPPNNLLAMSGGANFRGYVARVAGGAVVAQRMA